MNEKENEKQYKKFNQNELNIEISALYNRLSDLTADWFQGWLDKGYDPKQLMFVNANSQKHQYCAIAAAAVFTEMSLFGRQKMKKTILIDFERAFSDAIIAWSAKEKEDEQRAAKDAMGVKLGSQNLDSNKNVQP